MARDSSPGSLRVIGFQWSPATHDIKDFLSRSRVPYLWMDAETRAGARERMGELGVSPRELPLVIFEDGTFLRQPTDVEIAERVGLSTEAAWPFYDLVVVGGGPAGMSAAIYAGSEGLRTVILDGDAPGGQAGQSARIENFIGFPEGLSGNELAHRAVEQARRFEVEIVAARKVVGLRVEEPFRVVVLDDERELFCNAVLLATGVNWRTLDAPGCQSLVGAGVYYGAASAEASAVRGQDVYLLGGGNSAGQAAMHLARFARSVTMLVLEETIEEHMSQYLLDRIGETQNVHVRSCCTIATAGGTERLESLTIENVTTSEIETVPASSLFVFIGAAPETEWLSGVLERDANGFLLTGPDARNAAGPAWEPERAPFPLETSVPGVFAAGDVRAGSVKRIGAAVGDGATAIQFIHQWLAER
ncbi:MAG: FAD-dependent oxidoreductase [Gemmatimonadetes bacterium]|nr:FAD-dependent oxidoreductase [Gemmatimonadota bacterium]